MVAYAAFRIADTFKRDDVDAAIEWDRLADLIVPMGKDPNWRTRPSILDQLRALEWRSRSSPVPEMDPEGSTRSRRHDLRDLAWHETRRGWFARSGAC
jgi:hypothetical protein